MIFPWHDWQFWIVTGMAIAGLLILVRPFVRLRRSGPGCPGCEGCAPKSAAKPRSDLVTLKTNR